jgi:tetratricopeptide (TPR) repeat protein
MQSILLTLIAAVALASCRPSASPPAAGKAAAGNPARLMAGYEKHHHAITTTNREAQQFFDQGVALVFAFNHEEAVKSFARAAELDREAAMPPWGVAWALGPNYNLDIDDPRAKQAFEAIARARELAARAPENERAYIDAMAVRYSADPKADRAELARRYSVAMRDLTGRYPDDLDAATLYAESLMNLRPWKLWTLEGKPAEDTDEIVRVLESVLARDPDHIGANHYYIHSLEASPDSARAVASAKRLESLVPTAGHLVHMPAHIYTRIGDHGAAARANLAGADADREYLRTAPPATFYEMAYYSHNLHFLTYSHMMQGRFAEAQRASMELAERVTPHAAMMPMIESMAVSPAMVLLRFGRSEQVLQLPRPAADRPVMTGWWYFARAVSFARLGRVDESAAAATALQEAVRTVPESAMFGGTGLETARTVLALAGTVADARLQWARGARDQAIARWRDAVTRADRLAYDEPPVWFYPLRESLGAALLMSGRTAEAEQVFREDLQRNPRNPRSLFGLHASLVAQQKDADATWVRRALETAWANADGSLTIESL